MNRQQRRAAAKQFAKAAKIDARRSALQVALIRDFSVLEAFVLSIADPKLLTVVHGIAQFLAEAMASKKGRGPLCLACEKEFSASEEPIDFLITSPLMSDWMTTGAMMLTGICARCSQRSNDDLLAVGLQRVREIAPDAQIISEGGRA